MTISLPPKGNSAKVLDSYFSPLRVQAQAVPAMTVQVAEGSYWLADNTHQEYIGGTTPTIFKTISPSTSKWVVVTVTKNGVLNTIDGDASASPVLPAPATYFDELPLAAIFVTDTTTVITNEMIFDIRPLWSVPVDAISQSQLDDFATIVWVNNELAAKADITGTPEATFILNVGGSTINYSGIEVERAILPDVGIRFNETAMAGSPLVLTPIWEFTNDGTIWQPLGLTVDLYYTKVEADATFTPISHLMDDTLHITADQNTFLDGLTLTGSPALSGADVNQLIGISGNVQVLLDAKLDDVPGVANNIAKLDGAGELLDSGWTLNDAGSSITDLWSASQITTFTTATLATKADKIIPGTVNDIAGLDATGNLTDTGWRLDDAGTTINDLWSGSKLTTELSGKIDNIVGGTISNFASVESGGQVGDSGVSLASLTTGFVDVTTDQVVGGIKSFTDSMIIGGDLTVNGTTATISTQNLTVGDKNILINAGYVGPTSGSNLAGITVDRNATGSPPADPTALIVWEDATTRWKAGLDGSEANVGLEGVSLVQPFYELAVGIGGSPAGAVYALSFDVPMPVAGTAGIQVFVNGIKQIEGAGKSYTVTYGNGSPLHVIVAFNTGSEPAAGTDVEFYGFGFLA